MYPATNGALNPFDAHFLGCHVADLQTSCDKIYGTGQGTICKANSMTLCQVVGGASPSPPSPPAPSPSPSPVPGGEPTAECLECWQNACSVKQSDCAQCMSTNKDSCVAICKPSLFGQKMMDWYCQAETTVLV